jgi:isoleucyl-tRNA synthetase
MAELRHAPGALGRLRARLQTLDLDYMESVLWAFKSLWGKGLIYEGFRVLWYCWRCETPLSNTETKMDDVYRDRQDPR